MTSAVAFDRGLWVARGAVDQAYNDNIQQQEGAARDGAFISTLTGQISWEGGNQRFLPNEFRLSLQGHVYASFPEFNYFEVYPQASFELTNRTDFLLGYTYASKQLLYEESRQGQQVFYSENALEAGLRHRFGERKQLRTQLLFEAIWDDFLQQYNGRDAFIPGLLWDIRYVFPFAETPIAMFTPRLTVEYEARNASSDNYDRNSLDVGPGFALQLRNGMVLRFRYDRWWRDYTVGTPRSDGARNNNFKRNDNYQQFAAFLSIPIPSVPGLWVTPRYRFRDGTYDEPNRKGTTPQGLPTVGVQESFDVNEIGVELAYGFAP